MEVLEREISSKMDRVGAAGCNRGRVGINLNGKPGNFFRTFKGLKQGGGGPSHIPRI
jgi:hypothetical protein